MIFYNSVDRRARGLVLCLGMVGVSLASPAANGFVVERVTQASNPTGGAQVNSPLHLPVDVDTAPGDSEFYFVSQLGGFVGHESDGDAITNPLGSIVLMDRLTGTVDFANPFLTIDDSTTIEGHPNTTEVGLFSTVFHPEFQSNGKFYVSVAVDFDGEVPTIPGDSRVPPFKLEVREYTADPSNLAGGAVFSKTLLEVVQPKFNHNGSWIGFNPQETSQGQNNLYITLGDGGDQHDPFEHAQNTEDLLGTVLRIGVDGDDFPADPDRNYAIPADNPFVGKAGRDEIFAYGLRNPWRAGFDSETGDLYIGDVGQNTWEEVNLIPNNIGPNDDRNFGWRQREGFVATSTGGIGGPQPPDGLDPVIAYLHGPGAFKGNSVAAGIVYRGPIQELAGKYIFADSVSGNIWGVDVNDIQNFDPNNPALTLVNLNSLLAPQEGSYTSIVSFAEDESGNLLIVDFGFDALGIGGHIFRVVPEPLVGDLDGDGFVGITDLNIVLGSWNQSIPPGDPLADPSGDGFVGIEDLNVILGNWNAGTSPPTNNAIPEPATLGLVLLGSTLLLQRQS